MGDFFVLVNTDAIAIPVDLTSPDKGELQNANLLYPHVTKKKGNQRYPTSEWHQFWIVLKRTLLFSRRDWVRIKIETLTGVLGILFSRETESEISKKKAKLWTLEI